MQQNQLSQDISLYMDHVSMYSWIGGRPCQPHIPFRQWSVLDFTAHYTIGVKREFRENSALWILKVIQWNGFKCNKKL